jgi:thiol-disulfide isomerase/thioredoxin
MTYLIAVLLLATIPYETALKLAEKRDMPLVIEIGATWCGPCKIQKERLKRVYPNFVEIDVDEEPELADKFMKGDGIPQIIIFKKKNGGLEETFWEGKLLTEQQLRDAINKK